MSEMEEFKKKCQKFFDDADVDKSGSVTIQELRDVMKEICPTMTKAEVISMFIEFDKDGDKMITREEFMQEMLKPCLLEVSQKVFKELDTENTGKLYRSQIADFVRKCGEVQDEDKIQKIFDDVDTDGNGYLDFDEFMAAMKAS